MCAEESENHARQERRYPPFYEKAVPIAIGVVVVAIVIILIIAVSVALGVFPGGG